MTSRGAFQTQQFCGSMAPGFWISQWFPCYSLEALVASWRGEGDLVAYLRYFRESLLISRCCREGTCTGVRLYLQVLVMHLRFTTTYQTTVVTSFFLLEKNQALNWSKVKWMPLFLRTFGRIRLVECSKRQLPWICTCCLATWLSTSKAPPWQWSYKHKMLDRPVTLQ